MQIGGSLINAPLALLVGFFSGGLTSAWEFNIDMLALSLGLFGITYRYAVRYDANPNLKQGVVGKDGIFTYHLFIMKSDLAGAFALTRALNLIHVPTSCTALPLDCGGPFHYFTWSMIFEGITYGFESIVAFGGAAYCLEKAFEKYILGKFPTAQS